MSLPFTQEELDEMKKQVGSQSAIFVNPTKILEIQKSIEKIMKNKNIRKNLILDGKKRMKILSLENFSKKFNNIIKDSLI